jgi:hypothetical protein
MAVSYHYITHFVFHKWDERSSSLNVVQAIVMKLSCDCRENFKELEDRHRFLATYRRKSSFFWIVRRL